MVYVLVVLVGCVIECDFGFLFGISVGWVFVVG